MAHDRTVIWDWNGTLADDADASLLAVNDILDKRDMPPITMAQYYEYIDTPISRFYEHLFDLNEVPMSVISVEFAEGYARHFQGLHPGARELLQKLKDAGVDQIILSSNHLESTEAQLRRFGIRDYFSQVLGRRIVWHRARYSGGWTGWQNRPLGRRTWCSLATPSTIMTPQRPWAFPAFSAPLGISPKKTC